jgi:hypothetical protein
MACACERSVLAFRSAVTKPDPVINGHPGEPAPAKWRLLTGLAEDPRIRSQVLSLPHLPFADAIRHEGQARQMPDLHSGSNDYGPGSLEPSWARLSVAVAPFYTEFSSLGTRVCSFSLRLSTNTINQARRRQCQQRLDRDFCFVFLFWPFLSFLWEASRVLEPKRLTATRSIAYAAQASTCPPRRIVLVKFGR